MIFQFGKHKGKSFDEIIESDPRYVDWAYTKDLIPLTNKQVTNLEKHLSELIDNEYEDHGVDPYDFCDND